MRLVLAFFFSVVLSTVTAQRYSFVEYSTEIGLPQSQVTSIVQDRDGYLWIGTLGGLAKFNGKDFTSFTRENGLANNKIISLKFIGETLWVGHEGGVSKYANGKFSRWYFPQESKNSQVTQVIKCGKKTIIATNGIGLFELNKTGLHKIVFNAAGYEKIRDIKEFDKQFYIATKDGVYHTTNFEKFAVLDHTVEWSVSDLEIYQNKLCITTFQDGIHLYTPKTKSFFQIPISSDYSLVSSFADTKDKLWIAMAEGIGIYDGAKIQFINEDKGMPLVAINRVFKDREGNVWLGSAGKGLICFSGEQFVHYNQATGLPSDLIIDVNQDSKGQFWISTYNKGLVIKKNNGQFVRVHEDILTFWCSIMRVDGYNWFGTDEGLLAFSGTELKKRYVEAEKVTDQNKGKFLLGNKITSLQKISSTQFYIGGSSGLMLYDKGTITFLHNNDDKDIGTIRDMAMMGDALILATDLGLYTYQNKVVSSVDDFSIITFCLKKDNYGTLWLGTEEGLYMYDNGKIVSRNFSEETASKFINFLNFARGKLYIGTNNGLYVYHTSKDGSPKRIEHFGIQEGIVDLETNLNSSYIDNTGKLWFGTASGLVVYKEKATSERKEIPKLLLKNMFLNYKKSNLTSSKSSPLSLPYNKNNISFDFDGIFFSNPQELMFQFWLEGAEESWSRPSSSPTANYTGLRAGEYTLHARAVGPQANFSEELTFPFEIRPPFYQTWWFISISLLAVGSIVYAFIRFRINREREKGEKEKMVIKNKLLSLEQRSLNASMNRHFIFNSLNSIQFFINTQDRVSANKYLTNFAQLIRKNLDSSTSEGNLLPFSKEIERLKLYLSLESMRFKDRFDYIFEIDVPEAESILIPSMLLQPYIENSIVHGVLPKKTVKGEIKIRAWLEQQILCIRIEDNGIGISNSFKTKKHFDGDHRSQGVEITAKRISLIKQMSKQSFDIIGPEDLLDENSSINGTYVLLKIPFEDLEN